MRFEDEAAREIGLKELVEREGESLEEGIREEMEDAEESGTATYFDDEPSQDFEISLSSHTQYALLNKITRERGEYVRTIKDPAQFFHFLTFVSGEVYGDERNIAELAQENAPGYQALLQSLSVYASSLEQPLHTQPLCSLIIDTYIGKTLDIDGEEIDVD